MKQYHIMNSHDYKCSCGKEFESLSEIWSHIDNFRAIETTDGVTKCPECKGARFSPQSLAVKINKKSIAKICSLSIKSAIRFFNNLRLGKTEELIARDILKEVRERLTFLSNV